MKKEEQEAEEDEKEETQTLHNLKLLLWHIKLCSSASQPKTIWCRICVIRGEEITTNELNSHESRL